MSSYSSKQASTRLFPNSDDVVIFQPEFIEFGGEERVILALSKALHESERSHSILCYFDEIGLDKYASWPVQVHQLTPRKNFLSKSLSLRRALHSLHKKGSPPPLLLNIQSAYHAGLSVDVPYHIRIPDTYSLLGQISCGRSKLSRLRVRIFMAIRHFATRRGILRAQRFVTNTKALQTEMKAIYGRDAQVMYLGGFGSPQDEAPDRPDDPIELLSVSRLQASKRIDWILGALAEVRNSGGSEFQNWRLNIVGNGPEKSKLENYARNLGISDRVRFHGFVSNQILNQLYDQCHVFLMPARQGYGLPAIEALYRRMGVVLSDESGVVEILNDTEWVTVAHDGQQGFYQAVIDMLRRVRGENFFSRPLPPLPTESAWAENMLRYCY